ncbi:MAG: hypothetical protein AB1736_14485, partial [Chloroflexota bacterium]
DAPTDEPTDEPGDEPTDEPAAPRAGANEPRPSPTQTVLGAISTGGDNELPATDTVSDVVTGGSSILIILGLAGFAGAAVLLAPSRRREPDATE